jgi:hypothetical protein
LADKRDGLLKLGLILYPSELAHRVLVRPLRHRLREDTLLRLDEPS